MSIQCVIFDNDGVVNNSSEMFSEWYSREYGVPLSEMAPFFSGPFQNCMVGKADLRQELKAVLESWEWSGTVDEFLTLWFETENQPKKRMIELIRSLREKGIICCMATNQEKHRLQWLRKNGFSELFNHIYCSAEVGRKKKSDGFWEYVCTDINKRFGIKPAQILLVDDEKENVEAASHRLSAHQYTTYPTFISLLKKMNLFAKE